MPKDVMLEFEGDLNGSELELGRLGTWCRQRVEYYAKFVVFLSLICVK